MLIGQILFQKQLPNRPFRVDWLFTGSSSSHINRDTDCLSGPQIPHIDEITHFLAHLLYLEYVTKGKNEYLKMKICSTWTEIWQILEIGIYLGVEHSTKCQYRNSQTGIFLRMPLLGYTAVLLLRDSTYEKTFSVLNFI